MEIQLLLEEAAEKYQTGAFSEAAALVDEILASDPLSGKALSYRAHLYAREYDFIRAISTARTALTNGYKESSLLISCASWLRSAYLYEQAIEMINQMDFDGFTENEQAQLLCEKGNALSNLCRFEESLECFEKALEKEPDNIYANYGKSTVLTYFCNFSAARQAIEKALDINPNAIFLLHQHAITLSNLNSFEEAGKIYMTMIEMEALDCYGLSSQAEAYIYLNDNSKGLEIYREVLQQFPEYDYACRGMGNACKNLGDFQNAEIFYEKALKLDSRSYFTLDSLGYLFIAKGDYAAAINYFQRARLISSTLHNAWYGIGLAMFYLERYEESKYAFHRVLQVYPDNLYALRLMGQIHYELDHLKEALDYCQKSLELSKPDPQQFLLLGLISHKLGDFNAAKSFFEQYVEVFSDNQEIWQLLAELYEKDQDQEKMIEARTRINTLNEQRFTYSLDPVVEKTELNSDRSYYFSMPSNEDNIFVFSKFLSQDTILNYYDSLLLDGENVKINEAKIIVVGAGGAGKTSLIKKIIRPHYKVPNEEKVTHGVEVYFHQAEFGGDAISTYFWDFGGQEIYHATHQLFFTRGSLYILVVDSRKGSLNLDYWLYLIQFLSGDSPVLLVINEIEGITKDLEVEKLKKHFPGLKEVAKVNLANNKGLYHLREIIGSILPQINVVNRDIPANWMALRHHLGKLTENTITFEQFSGLCGQYEIRGESMVRSVSELLHHLGVILHYQGNWLLDNFIVLNIHWAIDAVYSIFESPAIINGKGIFDFQTLVQIWLANGYQREDHSGFLQLILQFEICYSINNHEYFVAPQFLPERPYRPEAFDGKIIWYEFQYGFLPKNIFSRLVVKMNRYINEESVWRNDVILKLNESYAHINNDLIEKKISIKITGRQSKELLFLIRENIYQIHNDYNQIFFEETVACCCSVCNQAETPRYFLFKDLEAAKRNHRHSLLCYQSWEEVNIDSLLENIPSQYFSVEKAKQLISSNQILEFLEFLNANFRNTPFEDDILILQSQYQNLKKDNRSGILDPRTQNLFLNDIRLKGLEILRAIQKTKP